MQKTIIDCSTGAEELVEMTAEEIAAFAQQQTAAQVAQAAEDAQKSAVQAAQVQAAQALIATMDNQQQADATAAFMRTLGLPL